MPLPERTEEESLPTSGQKHKPTPQTMSRPDGQTREQQLRASIYDKLTSSGELDRLKELLDQRLRDSGWRDELKKKCRQLIQEKGLEETSVDDLVAEITPYGRATVPDEVKEELLNSIREFMSREE